MTVKFATDQSYCYSNPSVQPLSALSESQSIEPSRLDARYAGGAKVESMAEHRNSSGNPPDNCWCLGVCFKRLDQDLT